MKTGHTQFIIYKVVSPSGKIYIGHSTKLLVKRKTEHYTKARHECKIIFHKALVKYGKKMRWMVIDRASDLETAQELERRYILHFRSHERGFGYNQTVGGGGAPGFHHNEITRLNMIIRWKGRHPGPESMTSILQGKFAIACLEAGLLPRFTLVPHCVSIKVLYYLILALRRHHHLPCIRRERTTREEIKSLWRPPLTDSHMQFNPYTYEFSPRIRGIKKRFRYI